MKKKKIESTSNKNYPLIVTECNAPVFHFLLSAFAFKLFAIYKSPILLYTNGATQKSIALAI
jgi:hypothetical protein